MIPSESVLAQIPGTMAWKNKELYYIGASQNMISDFGFDDLDDVVGQTVYDIKCPAVECAENFMEQDQLVLNTGADLTVLNIHPFADGQVKMLIGNRRPLFDGERIAGTIYEGIEVNNTILMSLGIALYQGDQHYYPLNHEQRCYRLANQTDTFKLSKREMECLYYLLRGKTAKQIARTLDLSFRTIEAYIRNIKLKFTCDNKSQLIEKAISHGYLNVLPDSLLTRNISLILQSTSMNAFT